MKSKLALAAFIFVIAVILTYYNITSLKTELKAAEQMFILCKETSTVLTPEEKEVIHLMRETAKKYDDFNKAKAEIEQKKLEVEESARTYNESKVSLQTSIKGILAQ